MIIREWTEKDLAAVAILEHACFEDPWTMDMIKGEFGRMDFCGSIAEEDGKPIGFLCGTLLFEDAEIAKVTVLKEYRGKGYGRQLVEEFFDKVKANGARRIFLEVRPSNEAALHLYQSNGFHKLRLRKRYYADGEDALEMMKDLYPDD